ncbi:hypothetical protein SUGI_1031680 [Cryptomeria japonica]|uniref:cytochrome P450 94A2 n=1 Tax=Cryptomeria japonica TaxID=3369 RepID=UPI0024149610|nr:cytochrome P450 94A2 [Cryptomeria japonica]GLJ48909.1 hypothetical protein SUGI_1031680 [Cryptomeria japonica]
MVQYSLHCNSYEMFFLCVALIPLLFIFIAHLFRKKSGGLTLYPILGFLPTLIKNRHRFHDWVVDILLTSPSATVNYHRPVGIIGLLTADPANVEHILKTRFENYEKSPRLKFIVRDFLGSGIFNADGELWKMQRKAASYEFNTKSLRNFVVETVQSEITDRLMPILSNVSNKGVSVNLQDVLQRFAFDNICRVAFGVDPAYLHPSLSQLAFARAFDDATELSFGRIFYSVPFAWQIKKMLNIGSEKRLREAISVVDEFALGIIQSRRKEIAEIQSKKSGLLRDDLLSRFMTTFGTDVSVEIEEKAVLTNKSDLFLRDMIVNFMLAGRDTSSTSLTWFFWVLSSHPTVEQAIRCEIMEILAKRKECTNMDEEYDKWIVFSYEELRDMQYLHAVVCESLRLYPPVPINAKTAVQDDVLPDGRFVGKGWGVDYSIYAMGRMKSIWGEDCEEFKPERWLKNGEFVGENAYKFAAFNAGPRICMGKEMAFIQMKSVVASIVHSFSVKVEEGFVAMYTLDFNMRMKGGLPVILTKRCN